MRPAAGLLALVLVTLAGLSSSDIGGQIGLIVIGLVCTLALWGFLHDGDDR